MPLAMRNRFASQVNFIAWSMSYQGGAGPKRRSADERTRVADEAHNSGIAGRYATAIFDLATDMKSVDAVAADFAALKRMIAGSPDLARLVRAPIFGREEQKK